MAQGSLEKPPRLGGVPLVLTRSWQVGAARQPGPVDHRDPDRSPRDRWRSRRLGGVALGRVNDGELMQRGGLAPQVTEALIERPGPLEELPRSAGLPWWDSMMAS